MGNSELENPPVRQEIGAQHSPDALNDLGIALMAQGRAAEAIAAYRKALAQRHDFAQAWTNLGTAFQSLGQLNDAIAAHGEAVRLRPGFAIAHNNLGRALFSSGRVDEAIASYRAAISLRQLGSVVHNNLGDALLAKGLIEDALEVRRAAAAQFPDCPDALNNLGNLLKDLGQLDESVEAFRKALRLRPDPRIHSNLLLTMNYCENADPKSLADEQRAFAEKYEASLLPTHRPHDVVRDPEKRLRLAYVSPDLREHPVGLFMQPIFAHHDHQKFEIICYSTSGMRDAMTDKLRATADRWVEAHELSDEQLAEMIRQDKIDILIDLSGHTAQNRLLVFARKPAPVQVTYLGYVSTTGLHSIEYTLTNRYLLPADFNPDHYCGRAMRLPNSYCCYQPHADCPEVSSLPARKNGFIIFGCLNNLAKVGQASLQAWAEILRRVPESHLLLYTSSSSRRDAITQFFSAQGISSNRLEFVGKQPMNAYFETFGRIDIALDPFPFNGGTTTLDSIWMGVPVITFPGELSIARNGLSMLASAGMRELVADDLNGYIQLACDLASDVERLSILRSSLRERLAASPVADAPLVTRDLENALRSLWREWCDARDRQAQ